MEQGNVGCREVRHCILNCFQVFSLNALFGTCERHIKYNVETETETQVTK